MSIGKAVCENYLFENYSLKSCNTGGFQESLFQEEVLVILTLGIE